MAGITNYIDPRNLRVYRNQSQNVCARVEGRGEWEKVVLKLAFPYSEPRNHIILATAEEQEIGVITEPEALDEDSRLLLEEVLQKRYYIPVIRRIISVKDAHESTRWFVETDRGLRSFNVQDTDNFKQVVGGKIIITDIDENRFCIPSRTAMSLGSRWNASRLRTKRVVSSRSARCLMTNRSAEAPCASASVTNWASSATWSESGGRLCSSACRSRSSWSRSRSACVCELTCVS